METTIYKANALINSPINLKYWVIDPSILETSYFSIAYVVPANNGTVVQLSIISFNGELSKRSSWDGTITLIDTYSAGSDTVYQYKFVSSGGTKCIAKFDIGEGVTKILVEAKDYVRLDNIVTASADNMILHADRNDIPTPLFKSSSETSFSNIVNVGLLLKDTSRQVDIQEFADILPHHNYIGFSGSDLVGDLAFIGSHIKVDQAMFSPKSQYAAGRLFLNGTKISGTVSSFVAALKARRATKWAFQCNFGDTEIIRDVVPTTWNAVYIICDHNGDISYYNSGTEFFNNIPDDPE